MFGACYFDIFLFPLLLIQAMLSCCNDYCFTFLKLRLTPGSILAFFEVASHWFFPLTWISFVYQYARLLPQFEVGKPRLSSQGFVCTAGYHRSQAINFVEIHDFLNPQPLFERIRDGDEYVWKKEDKGDIRSYSRMSDSDRLRSRFAFCRFSAASDALPRSRRIDGFAVSLLPLSLPMQRLNPSFIRRLSPRSFVRPSVLFFACSSLGFCRSLSRVLKILQMLFV